MRILKPRTFTMCHKRTPSHMAYIPFVGQGQHFALTRWIDMKATKSLHSNDLPFSIFRNVLFHDALLRHQQEGMSSPACRCIPSF